MHTIYAFSEWFWYVTNDQHLKIDGEPLFETYYFWRMINGYHDTANQTWKTPWNFYLECGRLESESNQYQLEI